MKQHILNTPAPGVLLGNYPQKRQGRESFTAWLKHTLYTPHALFGNLRAKPHTRFLQQIAVQETHYVHLSDARMRERVHEMRTMLSLQGLTPPLVAEIFALVRQVCLRELGIRPFDTQLIAARIMLDGKLAEMATGEGKTLAAAICVATAAMAGIPVHVITANDYLVERDAAWLRPLYTALGLTVGTITQPLDVEDRRKGYACNITYSTAKELVFDYLRDRVAGGHARSELHARVARLAGKTPGTLLHGLCMAVIDEADSILIDEARVPLILSQNVVNSGRAAYYQQALQLAAQMHPEKDFILDRRLMSAELTEAGRRNLEQNASHLNALWHNRMHREETICLSLAAHHLYQRDRHYLVRDDSVHIIDEITGRTSPGRVWSRGLHQLIEIKDGCKPSEELVTAAQITYQRFFPRYLRLCGMSGTLKESRAELFSVYGLNIETVPLRKPSQRITYPARIYRDQQAQWKAVVSRIREMAGRGRPVLIGTDSVADSEALSLRLQAAGLAHEVLNARQDSQEATIVARAGQPGQITVSTNMAGRGTDIPLGRGVAELGGLHVISCQHNPSRRIDRQLLGRCARQGNPGSFETLIFMHKSPISNLIPARIAGFVRVKEMSQPQWLVWLMLRLPQWREEAHQRKQRHDMLEQDALMEREALIPEHAA